MLTKKVAVFFASIAGGITLLFILLRPIPVFTYDFENFFAEDDSELIFYNQFRTLFENDNDYLLIALGSTPDVFDSTFLNQAFLVESELRDLENVSEIHSLLSAKDRIIGPFGSRSEKILQWDSDELLSDSKRKLSGDSSWIGNLITNDNKHLILILKNKQLISKSEGDRLYYQVVGILEKSGISDFKVAGKIKAQAEFVSLLQEEFSFFLGISFLLVLCGLYLIFRSIWGVLLPVLVLGLGFFWAISFLLLSGGELDVLAVMQPPILLVIGLSGIVHLLNHYTNGLKEGLGKKLAIQHTFKELTVPVFLTSLTTALGFFSLAITDVISLKSFGWYTGFGVLWMFLGVILIMPLALYLFPPLATKLRVDSENFWRKNLGFLFLRILRWRKVIHIFFVLLSVVAALAIAQVKTNGYILDNLPDDHPLVLEFSFFDQEFGGSKPLEFYIEVGTESKSLLDFTVLQEIDKLEKFIQKAFQAGTILSPLTLVKSLNKAQNQGNSKAFTFPTEAQFDRMYPLLGRYVDKQPIPLLSADRREGRITSYMADVGSLRGYELEKQLEEFVQNYITANLLQVRMTGTSYLIDRSHKQVTEQLLSGLGIAFLCVALLTGILFRSWRMAVIGLIPNIIPILWMGCVMFLLGVNFNLSTAIIFTVAFGIAVDDSIHFISKLGGERKKGKSLIYGLKRTYLTTGKALILTTAILSSGFLVLTWSDFQITFYSGLLIGISLTFALLADLLWLPLLILPLTKVWERN